VRRRGIAAALVAVLFLTAGCWSRVEINDLAIVTMMAIERVSDQELQIWVQVAVPGNAGSAPGATGESRTQQGPPFITLTAKGQTLPEAARRIQLRTPRRLFWAHTRVVLIGEQLARSGLQGALDFLTRHRELRLTNFILVARGEVTDMMAVTVDLERLPAEYLREIERSGVGVESTVGDLARTLGGQEADPVLAVAAIQAPAAGAVKGQRPTLGLAGSALFRGDRLVSFLDEGATRGLLWLRGEMKRGEATTHLPGLEGAFTVEWTHARVARKARWENGRIVISFQVTVEADLSDEQVKADVSDPATLNRMERQVEAEVRSRMLTVLARIQKQHVDAAELGELVHRQLPGVWQRVKKRWHDRELERVKAVVAVQAHIRRTGLSNKPRGVKDEEVKKVGE
jgi:spore germination protein KC